MEHRAPVLVSYGGGTNSVAMLVSMLEAGERPDLILFCDTGGEKPYTYEHIALTSEWCASIGFPPITSITKEGLNETLEQRCLRLESLPSIAYGSKNCSQSFKRNPQEKFCNHWGLAKTAWRRDLKVVKCVGFDAGEPHRAKPFVDDKYTMRYPLIELDWDRDDCVAAIERVGLPQPGKSACFFCPSSKKAEVLKLKDEYPLLFRRAVEIERNAKDLRNIKGLGRHWSWEDLAGMPSLERVKVLDTVVEIDCGCYDGE